jgi:hypothetical protein
VFAALCARKLTIDEYAPVHTTALQIEQVKRGIAEWDLTDNLSTQSLIATAEAADASDGNLLAVNAAMTVASLKSPRSADQVRSAHSITLPSVNLSAHSITLASVNHFLRCPCYHTLTLLSFLLCVRSVLYPAFFRSRCSSAKTHKRSASMVDRTENETSSSSSLSVTVTHPATSLDLSSPFAMFDQMSVGVFYISFRTRDVKDNSAIFTPVDGADGVETPIFWVNKALCDVLGYTQPELMKLFSSFSGIFQIFTSETFGKAIRQLVASLSRTNEQYASRSQVRTIGCKRLTRTYTRARTKICTHTHMSFFTSPSTHILTYLSLKTSPLPHCSGDTPRDTSSTCRSRCTCNTTPSPTRRQRCLARRCRTVCTVSSSRPK